MICTLPALKQLATHYCPTALALPSSIALPSYLPMLMMMMMVVGAGQGEPPEASQQSCVHATTHDTPAHRDGLTVIRGQCC
jgi:hypothetical protein